MKVNGFVSRMWVCVVNCSSTKLATFICESLLLLLISFKLDSLFTSISTAGHDVRGTLRDIFFRWFVDCSSLFAVCISCGTLGSLIMAIPAGETFLQRDTDFSVGIDCRSIVRHRSPHEQSLPTLNNLLQSPSGHVTASFGQKHFT